MKRLRVEVGRRKGKVEEGRYPWGGEVAEFEQELVLSLLRPANPAHIRG